MSISFDEILINEVQKYPHLYDLSDANHKNKFMRENAWQQIGFAMERNADNCKERFKYLRDKYRKEKYFMNLPSGSHRRIKKPWALYSAMSFLDPCHQTKSSCSNLLSQDEKDVQQESVTDHWLKLCTFLLSPFGERVSLKPGGQYLLFKGGMTSSASFKNYASIQ
ncbi:hypothetical protein CEXT_239301 [Caerostris extrusa]|uniref:MADF domain-containing protein n=1 Tax=Caerostris extrusa TaxID=172846 RepID=A0AAV4NRJ7_CAEEX|nr:hypothetical protein CEXT_239301 [Caerostris extrusa]